MLTSERPARRGAFAVVLALLTVALIGALTNHAVAQSPTVELDRTVLLEGQTVTLQIANAPEARAHFIRLKPFSDPYTASAADLEVRGDNNAVASAGSSVSVTRTSDGAVQFSVVARSDDDGDPGETFGVQLCSSDTDCSGEALLGEWTLTIIEPAESPKPDDLGDLEDPSEGLIDEDLGDSGLGEAEDELSVQDFIGEDGVYQLRDGDNEIPLRPLLPPGTAAESAYDVQGAQGNPNATDLSALAANAGAAYAPSADNSGKTATPSNWFVADNGQLYLLVGGVNVFFHAHVDETQIQAVWARQGVPAERVSPIGELPNAFLVQTESDVESLSLVAALSAEPSVDTAVPNLFTPRSVEPVPAPLSYPGYTKWTDRQCKRYTKMWTDQFSSCLWHLKADTDYRFDSYNPTLDINLGNVWETTKGDGVTVAVVDGTWEGTHEDIRDNVDSARSKYWNGFTGENTNSSAPYHGTAVAGIIGARDNTVGGRGVAPRAKLVNYNILDGFSFSREADAMTRNMQTVAVYNMSYGSFDKENLYRSSYAWRQAVEQGIAKGMGGKGVSYVKAAGNGAYTAGGGWATLEEENNHRGVISVCAANSQGGSSYYSENGPSLWVCAPSSDGTKPGILAPIGKKDYILRFSGTSAAAPIVSGVIALMRSANTNLTWRDVKVILANTAQKNDPTHSSWMSGANKYGSSTEQYSFSYEYGFGTVDAKAAVTAASSWTLLPPEERTQASSTTTVSLPKQGAEITLTLDIQSTMDFIEHVEIAVDINSVDARDYRWTLVAPSGRESLLAPQFANCDERRCEINGFFRFGSSRHLGENPTGTWKLKVKRFAPNLPDCGTGNGTGVLSLNSSCARIKLYDERIEQWKIVVSGHSTVTTQPVALSVSPSSVTEGGEINLSVTLTGTAPTQDLVVPLKLTAGTATAPGSTGADYASLASITIPAGSSTASAKLATTSDDTDEPDETFTVGLGSLPAGYRAAGSATTVTIKDDDPLPTVTLQAAGAAVTEGESVQITAGLSHASSEDVTLDLSATPITPAVAGDGSLGSASTLTIAAGETTSTGRVTFTATDNNVYELSAATAKTFQISATATGGNGVAAPDAITVEIDDNESPPEVGITAGGNVVEGSDASFTLTATPSPSGELTVNVAVTVVGDYGVTAGSQTVTIPTSGSATLTLPTSGDEVDESDGSVTVTIESGTDYTPAATPAASVTVSDDDDPAPTTGYTVDPQVVADVEVWAAETHNGAEHVNRWQRVLVAFGELDASGVSGIAMTASEAKVYADRGWPRWVPVVAELTALEASQSGQLKPELSISAGGGITEGGDATFTVTANPAPAANLDVSVTVSQSGEYGATTGQQTVTIPTTGSVTLTVGTTNDDVNETDGSVTATLDTPAADAGYTVSSQGAATVSVADDDVPEISISTGSGVTEGGDATFTITASPTPAANLDVSVTVSQSGDYGATTGQQTVTIPTTGSVTLTVSTTNDDADETDGSVTATLDTPAADAGYTVSSSQGAATVDVADDDDASSGYTVDPQVVADVKVWVAETHNGAEHVNRWQRVLVAFGELDASGVSGVVMTAAEAQTYADRGWPRWVPVVAELTALEASQSGQLKPELSISAGGGITEGGDATFTVTASPAPTANLLVSVTVSQSGDYGATTGAKTVTIPTSGSATFKVGTTNDQTDEPNGSVTVTLVDGTSYDLGTSKTATVSVADNDDPPVVVVPVVTISGGNGVTEGGSATFTLSASPAPSANLSVTVTVSQSGDYGATTGSKTVTVPTSGSATFTVGTTNDQTDEPNGSVTATLVDGADYNLGTSKTATVSVADNDDPPVVVVPVVTISGGNSVTEGGNATFTLSASPAPSANLSVTVTVSASGDYGATTGSKTVTVPTSGSATFTIGTTNDQVDEPNGSVTATLVDGADYDLGTSKTATVSVADNDDPPVVVIPVVTISGGSGVTEGGDATFTLSASPAPSANLSVTVTVSASGDFGATAGTKTVTVSTSGSATFTVGTTNDQADEADGSVTATLVDGADYDLGATKTATVAVSDDDVPELSISAGGGITEGGSASFTITASPTPASPITVKIAVSESGDFGASGAATITVSGGSTTYTVSTSDDELDETDGSVTATLKDGSGYTVSSSSGAATVAVSDDDDPPAVELSVSIDDASGTEGGYLEFTVRLSRASTEEVVVNFNSATAPYDRTRTGGRARSNDYDGVYDRFVFKPGVTELTGQVWLKSDGEVESDEYFAIELFLGEGWKFKPDATGIMTIIDAD